jgi:hypothetical protein
MDIYLDHFRTISSLLYRHIEAANFVQYILSFKSFLFGPNTWILLERNLFYRITSQHLGTEVEEIMQSRRKS